MRACEVDFTEASHMSRRLLNRKLACNREQRLCYRGQIELGSAQEYQDAIESVEGLLGALSSFKDDAL